MAITAIAALQRRADHGIAITVDGFAEQCAGAFSIFGAQNLEHVYVFQRAAGIAKHLLQGRVGGQHPAVEIQLEEAILNVVEYYQITAFALLDTLEHVVDLAGQLPQFISPVQRQTLALAVLADLADLLVHAQQAPQNPAFKAQVTNAGADQHDQQHAGKEQIDYLAALGIDRPVPAQQKAQGWLPLLGNHAQAGFLKIAHQQARCQPGLAAHLFAADFEGKCLARSARVVFQYHLLQQPVFQAFLPFVGNEEAHHQCAIGGGVGIGVTDRCAGGQHGTAVKGEPFGEAGGRAVPVLVEAAARQLIQCAQFDQCRVVLAIQLQPGQLLSFRHMPDLVDQTTLAVVEQDEVQGQVVQGFLTQVAAAVFRIALLDEAVAVLPPSPVTTQGLQVLHLLVQFTVQLVGRLGQVIGIQLVETLQQQMLTEQPNGAQADQHQRQKQQEQAAAQRHQKLS